MLGFNWILLFEAYQYTAVSTATLCYYMEPVFFILASPIVLKDIDGINISFVQLSTATVVLIPYVVIIEGTSTLQFTSLSIFMLFIIGIIHTGIAYALYYSCLKNLKSQTVALYSYIDPVVSVILAIIILNEDMNFIKIVGTILILGAATINELHWGQGNLNLGRSKSRKTTSPTFALSSICFVNKALIVVIYVQIDIIKPRINR